jgi:hypothetical protein
LGRAVANPALIDSAHRRGPSLVASGLALFGMVSFVWLIFAAPSGAAPRPKAARSTIEFVPQTSNAFAAFEVELPETVDSTPRKMHVTDAILFVSAPAGDAASALAAPNDDPADGLTKSNGEPTFLNVRLFVVAGGRLYGGGRGKCSRWQGGLSRCQTACDSGSFALRRNGAAPLELLVGAIPGGAAGTGTGIPITNCGFDETGDVKLVAKSGRGLAVAGFGSD